jgi:hypothetical protein
MSRPTDPTGAWMLGATALLTAAAAATALARRRAAYATIRHW